MSTAADPSWRPLRERLAGQTGERALVEGTPLYLVQPLRDWLNEAVTDFDGQYDLAMLLQLRLRDTDVVPRHRDTDGVFVVLDGDSLLEAIDATLNVCGSYAGVDGNDVFEHQWWGAMLLKLQLILDTGGSAWKLNDDLNGLARRVDETVAQAAWMTMQAAPTDAADHLKRAWNAAYGMNPDASKAYSEAVKAVEAVVIPAAIPNDRQGTLGKALAHIKQTAAKWTVAVDQSRTPASADVLIAMLALVWHGQRDRHAGPNTAPVTLESAQTVLHAAVTLVQWFTSGAIRKAS
ncbi:hypothetical protein [Nonomuraea sp. NPDC050202]|jgi:hypothetical protein|uniref:hypothetical protein n=1 Tax=Nonomuraea sp. NPDC050202 TaxID=3155035 RepID=UPI0033CB3509